jgi:hypothetical protein
MPNIFRKRKTAKPGTLPWVTVEGGFGLTGTLKEPSSSTSSSQASRKADDSVLNKYRKKKDFRQLKGTGRRPSVEERTMKDAYHAGLVDGGVVI